MIVSPKKLLAFVRTFGSQPMASIEPYEPMDEGDKEQIEEALEDETSEEAEFARKVQANYMELSQPAGGFACGNCRFYKEEGSVCMQPSVRSSVDGDSGSCNFFVPNESVDVIFPPMEGDGDGDEDDESGDDEGSDDDEEDDE